MPSRGGICRLRATTACKLARRSEHASPCRTSVISRPAKSIPLLHSHSGSARQTRWGNGPGERGAKRSPCLKRCSPICGREPAHKRQPCEKSEAVTEVAWACSISCSKFQQSTSLLWSKKPGFLVLFGEGDHLSPSHSWKNRKETRRPVRKAA